MAAPPSVLFGAPRETHGALVDGSNPRDRPGLVVENLVGNMGRNAQPGHPRYAGPTQIVKPPSRHPRGRLIIIWNLPARVPPQMKVKPRKLKVSVCLPAPLSAFRRRRLNWIPVK